MRKRKDSFYLRSGMLSMVLKDEIFCSAEGQLNAVTADVLAGKSGKWLSILFTPSHTPTQNWWCCCVVYSLFFPSTPSAGKAKLLTRLHYGVQLKWENKWGFCGFISGTGGVQRVFKAEELWGGSSIHVSMWNPGMFQHKCRKGRFGSGYGMFGPGARLDIPVNKEKVQQCMSPAEE